MDTNTRIEKGFKSLSSFSKEILVQCPHCNKKAYVLTEQGDKSWDTKSKFRCYNCYKPIDEKSWYGPIVIYPLNAKCGHCGASLKCERVVKKYQSKMKVKCPACEHEQFYETRYKVTYANNNQATDPYFGLQLWLQLPIDDNILWAYNFEHLNYLKTYVSAKLREATSGSKYSLAWRLPNFIKLAKNREKILKAIERLEKEAPKV
jgi:predicted Zn-ribbon and HTH transcriptional regulator